MSYDRTALWFGCKLALSPSPQVPLVPVSDKYLGTTWIAVLELPPGENEVQVPPSLIVDI